MSNGLPRNALTPVAGSELAFRASNVADRRMIGSSAAPVELTALPGKFQTIHDGHHQVDNDDVGSRQRTCWSASTPLAARLTR